MSSAIDGKERRQRIFTLEALAPFTPGSVINELCSGRYFMEYRERRLQILREQMHRAVRRQQFLGAINAGRETRVIGGGAIRHKLCIDDEIEFRFRQQYGRHCWQDPDFVKDTWKKSPEVRIPEPRRRSFPVNGFKDLARGLVRSETCASGETRTKDVLARDGRALNTRAINFGSKQKEEK